MRENSDILYAGEAEFLNINEIKSMTQILQTVESDFRTLSALVCCLVLILQNLSLNFSSSFFSSSSSLALQPKLGLGLFSSPPPEKTVCLIIYVYGKLVSQFFNLS